MGDTPFAQFSLRFREGISASELGAVFSAVPGWEPELAPAIAVRRGLGWPAAATRFVASDLTDLVGACVLRRPLDWTFGTRSGQADWSVRTAFDQVFVDLRFYWASALSPRMIALLSALPPGVVPGMAFAVDRLRDEPLTRDGLHEISGMPPLLFLDDAATIRVGEALVRGAPCRVDSLPGGLLLVISDELEASVTPLAYGERAQVLSHLGLFPGASLR